MPIFGWDASHYDASRGPVNLADAVRNGISFITHKATEGAGYTDARFAGFARRAHGVVPLPGAYHVLHSGSIDAQVDHFLSVLRQAAPWWQTGAFLVQLDCEHWPADFPGAADIKAWCGRFMSVTKSTHRPIVYASRGQYGDRLATVPCPLWNANYPSGRAAGYRTLYPGDTGVGWRPYSGRPAVIWQYTSTATIGRQPGCDANAYRGTLDQLRALVWPAGRGKSASTGGPLMALTDKQQTDMYYTLVAGCKLPDGTHVPTHVALTTLLAKADLSPAELESLKAAAAQGAQAGALASADALIAAVQAKLGDVLTADMTAAVRAVFADAGAVGA